MLPLPLTGAAEASCACSSLFAPAMKSCASSSSFSPHVESPPNPPCPCSGRLVLCQAAATQSSSRGRAEEPAPPKVTARADTSRVMSQLLTTFFSHRPFHPTWRLTSQPPPPPPPSPPPPPHRSLRPRHALSNLAVWCDLKTRPGHPCCSRGWRSTRRCARRTRYGQYAHGG